MFFEEIKIKWKESLAFFSKEELTQFFLASLNTFNRSLKILVNNFWWLLLLFLASLVFVLIKIFWLNGFGTNITFSFVFGSDSKNLFNFFQNFSQSNFYDYISFNKSIFFIAGNILFLFFLSLIINFFLVLAIRPSVEAKDFRYFFIYLIKYWPLLIVLAFINNWSFFPICAVFAFFFLDSIGDFKCFIDSFFNGVKLIVYYFPVFAFIGLINFLVEILFISIGFLLNLILDINLYLNLIIIVTIFLTVIFEFLLTTLFLSFISIYYIKIKHQDIQFFK